MHSFERVQNSLFVFLLFRPAAELLRKLTDAAGGKSEDAKAPLKAVRNALDTIVSN
jgi:hypothetical protein